MDSLYVLGMVRGGIKEDRGEQGILARKKTFSRYDMPRSGDTVGRYISLLRYLSGRIKAGTDFSICNS